MSCHRIGRALNYVQEEILEQYEAGEFDKETAQVLLLRCVEAVGFCDGNSGEATETFDKAYCSDCMRKVENGEKLYRIFWNYLNYRNVRKYYDDHDMIGSKLCDKCFTRMFSDLGMSPDEIAQEKEGQFPD